MLWDVVFEFFVKYIFGGYLEDNLYTGAIGTFFDNGLNMYFGDTGDIALPVFNSFYVDSSGLLLESPLYMPIGNYLSFIATIITMIVILVLCAQLIKKIYNMCAHVIG